MNKTVKWIFAVIGCAVALIVIAVIVLPMVIDVEKYKPQIQHQVEKATGRTFKLGGDLKPSIFPWVGIRLSDLHLGNPSGFEEQDLVSVESFEVRVKLLPLLSRTIEVRRFVVDKPVLVLEKRKDGKGGWEGLGKPAEKTAAQPKDLQTPAPRGEFPIKRLLVGEFAVTNGRILWIDHAGGTRKTVEDINLVLTDLSFDKPIGVAFSALADQQPVKLDGTVGPLGDRPGKSPISLKLAARLLDELEVRLDGRIDPSAAPPKFDLAVDVADFSPRRIMDRLGLKPPLETADANVLNAVAVALNLKGTPEAITVSDGRLKLDDSRATFSAQAGELTRPNLKFDLDLDGIDLDRYLPPPAEGDAGADTAPETPAASASQPTDYGPLRRLVLDARLKTGELKIKKARMQNIEVRVSARSGIIRLDPLKIDLYQGNIAGTGVVNVQQEKPSTAMHMMLNSVQAGPLIKDLMDRELIEGAMAADIDLNFKGEAPDLIRKTLGGKGNLQFTDGAIVGIDLASMVRNVQASFGLTRQPSQKPRTDFAELQLPFSITSGLFKTDATRLVSPLMRVLAVGKADLAGETLDFRVEPKFVATIKGQGDTTQRSGIMVPVIVSGSLTAPTFKPDLKSMLGQQLGQPLPDKEALKKMMPSEEDAKKNIEEGVKGLLKGLPFGSQ
ncbi:cell envelope biogenesis protein AsmA [Desulfosarcina alkanivorans]|uniref:Cell envelope biogenesis protein AsmA n=1 Tax=Desulfosarcina alkanivorans TaxID=571177 RepID=A0A5K7Z202_9BACT|nr:AsmA family protein [Desulfosarcina alkanivorans]BBO72514.1 cell envelope biogenesis protein AsmA [Desulfosarcina alkanivorans]